MRIYNATNAQLNLPFPGGTVSIAPHAVSGNLGANTQSISLLVSAYTTDEIAFIVSGPFELNLCSSIPTVVNYVVQSLEEAIEKLEPKPIKKEEVTIVEENKPKVETKDDKKLFVKKVVKKIEPKIEKVEEDTVVTIADSDDKEEEPAAEEPKIVPEAVVFDTTDTDVPEETADDERGKE